MIYVSFLFGFGSIISNSLLFTWTFNTNGFCLGLGFITVNLIRCLLTDALYTIKFGPI